jgi:hypothetical protein
MDIKCAACGHEQIDHWEYEPYLVPVQSGEEFIRVRMEFYVEKDPYPKICACPKCVTLKMVD